MIDKPKSPDPIKNASNLNSFTDHTALKSPRLNFKQGHNYNFADIPDFINPDSSNFPSTSLQINSSL
jgi:hypothetical protein